MIARSDRKGNRKRSSPLERGDLHIWAGAVIYTVGSINFLVDARTMPPEIQAEAFRKGLIPWLPDPVALSALLFAAVPCHLF